MSHAAINTIHYIKRLEKAGFVRQQAEALAEANSEFINDNFATQHQLEQVRLELKHEIKSVRTELQAEIQTIRSDIIIKLGSAIVGCTAILGVLIAIFH